MAGIGNMQIPAAAIFFVVANSSWAAAAPEFPAKPLRIVVSTAAGAGPDVVARLLATKLTESWGQPIVIDQRPGASGLIGAETVAKASPDGYTMWLGTMTTMIGTLMHKRFLMADEFAPVSLVASTVSVIGINAALPVNTISELIAFAKSRPGQVLYGSSGQGTTSHLCMENFNGMAGIKMEHVPYKAATNVLIDLMGGQIHVTCATALSWMSLKGARARGLAVTTRARSVLAPDMPPVAETLPDFEMLSWLGLLAPRATPGAVVSKLNAAVVRVLKLREVQERLVGMGAEAIGNSPDEFAVFLRRESEKWGAVLNDADIRPIN
jgi:tripartite-type tricarboxylate transporter receptor subunit TctC